MNNPTFNVVKIFRNSGRRQILRKNLTEHEAQQVVQSYPSRTKSMVVYFSNQK